ncbi:hypothetical protein H9Q09_00730 [Aurantimonas sp. DM33-3]|uniref:hypothetical protein n=1 Tax=Aurantimonas sp. DM33-3 TaxID=2766955 RepID=UPI001651F221|nr:hypothetical protein [Aurantimonas sp. DM33-3]MBC6714710.1 hypothetical protein [Aurantimonas sp. DM33-3]
MTGTTTRGETFADAMGEIETPIFEAKDRANALQCLCELTLCENGYVLSEEHKDCFIHLIGEVWDASRKVATVWSEGWNAAVLRDYGLPDQDPMLALVSEYRKGVAVFNASGDLTDAEGEALAAATWRASYERLCTAPPAPTTDAGAIAAVRLVRQECSGCGYQPALIENVLSAVMVFLEGRAAA